MIGNGSFENPANIVTNSQYLNIFHVYIVLRQAILLLHVVGALTGNGRRDAMARHTSCGRQCPDLRLPATFCRPRRAQPRSGVVTAGRIRPSLSPNYFALCSHASGLMLPTTTHCVRIQRFMKSFLLELSTDMDIEGASAEPSASIPTAPAVGRPRGQSALQKHLVQPG